MLSISPFPHSRTVFCSVQFWSTNVFIIFNFCCRFFHAFFFFLILDLFNYTIRECCDKCKYKVAKVLEPFVMVISRMVVLFFLLLFAWYFKLGIKTSNVHFMNKKRKEKNPSIRRIVVEKKRTPKEALASANWCLYINYTHTQDVKNIFSRLVLSIDRSRCDLKCATVSQSLMVIHFFWCVCWLSFSIPDFFSFRLVFILIYPWDMCIFNSMCNIRLMIFFLYVHSCNENHSTISAHWQIRH